MRLAVVGHVEWFDFVLAGALPGAGTIAAARDGWEAPAGGGAMAAYALKALTGAATFFCGVGDDARGAAAADGLRAAGLDVHAAVHAGAAQPRALTWLTDDHERTITTVGPPLEPLGADPLPWSALSSYDGVVVFAGDAAALRAARATPLLVATGRVRAALLESGVRVDALVGSASDALETLDAALLAATRPRWVVTTEGAAGGVWRAGEDGAAAVGGPRGETTSGRWRAVPPPGPPVDAFGCGDAFAAALMAGLAAGRPIDAACALGARVGATVLSARAPGVGALAPLWDAFGRGADASPLGP
jgi:ribokinase